MPAADIQYGAALGFFDPSHLPPCSIVAQLTAALPAQILVASPRTIRCAILGT
jgi:hypothetical protein